MSNYVELLTTNLLTRTERKVFLSQNMIEKVVDEKYALAIYPNDNGKFTLWAEPMYLFDEQALLPKVTEYEKFKNLMGQTDVDLTKNGLSEDDKSRLHFEWFGYYQTCTNVALMIDQWTIATETREMFANQLIEWQIGIQKAK